MTDRLEAMLRRNGFPLDWVQMARDLQDGRALAPRPAVYDATVLRELHGRDPEQARAVMRTVGGWSAFPHKDADFYDALDLWEHGHPADVCDPNDPEGHFVAAAHAICGPGEPCEVAVANCKDCGLPFYTVGLEYWIDRDEDNAPGWYAIWRPAVHPGGQR